LGRTICEDEEHQQKSNSNEIEGYTFRKNFAPKATNWHLQPHNQGQFDPTSLFDIYPNSVPILSIYSVNQASHTIGILKTKKRFRFVDTNAGIISCKQFPTLINTVDAYLLDPTIYDKYTIQYDRSGHPTGGQNQAMNIVLYQFYYKN